MAGGFDPRWLVPERSPGEATPAQAPPLQGGGGTPFLKAIAFSGLDQPGRESVTFTYIDGVRLTETHGELASLGASPQEIAMVVKATAGWAEAARLRHHGVDQAQEEPAMFGPGIGPGRRMPGGMMGGMMGGMP